MDALGAIGLASNVIQFVEFAFRIVTTGVEVFKSTGGTTETNLELEKVYTSLHSFTLSLNHSNIFNGHPQTRGLADDDWSDPVAGDDQPHSSLEIRVHIQALRELAVECRVVCDELLLVIKKSKVSNGRWRAFSSFKAALRAIWDEKKIAELESRISRFQTTIALHSFPILSAQQSEFLSMVKELRSEASRNSIDQSSKLDEVLDQLTNLQKALSGYDEGDNRLLQKPEDYDEAQQIQLSLKEDAKARNAFEVRVRVEALSQGISTLSLVEAELRDITQEQAILRSLKFPSLPVRHDNIPVAYRETFRWSLSSSQEEEEEVQPDGWNDNTHDATKTLLSTWLNEGDGIFWVSGRAGSGKSTFMKYVASHERTKELLQEWAHPKKLILASHYFWSAGSAMQKSEEGLLRTLLFEIFRACPSLISSVCRSRWEVRQGAHSGGGDAYWTVQELRAALSNIAQHQNQQARYCLFVDGVDEYGGDSAELCETFQSLSMAGSVKLCLSSRPWNIFEDSFGQDDSKKIYIHDLTYSDIQKFTRSRLTQHPRWHHKSFSTKDKDCIITEISTKAHGVFLWVFLVAKALRKGLTDGDTARDLFVRLRSLPSDLERFFKLILDTVDEVYTAKMAHTLRTAANALEPHHFLVYLMQDQEFEEELDRPAESLLSSITQESLQDARDLCRRRISARCGGLLEIISGDHVEFLHRTVRDFLRGREMSDHLSEKSNPGFHVNLSTFKALVGLRRIRNDTFAWVAFQSEDSFQQALRYANQALVENEGVVMDLLDELQWNVSGLDEEEVATEILRAGIAKYVRHKLRFNPHFFGTLTAPVEVILSQKDFTTHHYETLRTLLEVDEESICHDKVQFRARARAECLRIFFSYVTYFGRVIGYGDDFHARYYSWLRSDEPVNQPDYCARAIVAELAKARRTEDGNEARLQEILQGIDPSNVTRHSYRHLGMFLDRAIELGSHLGWEMEFLFTDMVTLLPGKMGDAFAEVMRTRLDIIANTGVERGKRAALGSISTDAAKRLKTG